MLNHFILEYLLTIWFSKKYNERISKKGRKKKNQASEGVCLKCRNSKKKLNGLSYWDDGFKMVSTWIQKKNKTIDILKVSWKEGKEMALHAEKYI